MMNLTTTDDETMYNGTGTFDIAENMTMMNVTSFPTMSTLTESTDQCIHGTLSWTIKKCDPWGYIGEHIAPKFAALLSIIFSSILIAELLKDFKAQQRQQRGEAQQQQQREGEGGQGGGGKGGTIIISKILFSVSVGDIIFSL